MYKQLLQINYKKVDPFLNEMSRADTMQNKNS